MNSQTRHPDPDQLDQLRAGLLDDQIKLKAELENHLLQCKQCQQVNAWEHIADHTVMTEQLEPRLVAIRKKAMNPATRHSTRLLPIAAAASVVALLSASILFNNTGQDMDTDPAFQVQAESEDIYEDLDFYQWMADQIAENEHPAHTSDQQG
jgi:hypothetical protein